MEKKKYSIKDDFSMLAILIIPAGVAVNFAGEQLAQLLRLPMYLDTIGTIFTAMLGGPWLGAVTGCLTNVVTGIANPEYFAFIPVNAAAGLLTGWLSRKNMFSVWWKWIISILLMSWTSIIISAPIVVLVYGGVTTSGTSLIAATAMAAGANIWAAVIGTEGIFTVLDRVISFGVSRAVIKVIPPKTLIRFSCGSNYIKPAETAHGNNLHTENPDT